MRERAAQPVVFEALGSLRVVVVETVEM